MLDANVLVSALLSRAGTPSRLIEAWLGGRFELVGCEALLEELERALASPRLRGRIDPQDASGFATLLREHADVVADPAEPPPVPSRDPGDDYLIALAAREQVPLVSGDAHCSSSRPSFRCSRRGTSGACSRSASDVSCEAAGPFDSG